VDRIRELRTMGRQCSVRSCRDHTSGYSTLCEAHKRTQRRHGHPEQISVTVFELKPYRTRVEARRAKNPTNPAWALLEARWHALTGHADATLHRYSVGAAGVSYERRTAEHLVVLRDSVPATAVIDTALAMFALEEQRPSRFKSDRAFGFQLARRVRGLAEANATKHKDATTGRVKRTYRDVPPRVLECLAESLKVAFGVAGMKLAQLELKDAEGVQAERRKLHDALEGMK
jgi:hypothetical protein